MSDQTVLSVPLDTLYEDIDYLAFLFSPKPCRDDSIPSNIQNQTLLLRYAYHRQMYFFLSYLNVIETNTLYDKYHTHNIIFGQIANKWNILLEVVLLCLFFLLFQV